MWQVSCLCSYITIGKILSWLYLFNTDVADMNFNAFSALSSVHQLHLIKGEASDVRAEKCSISNHHHHNHRRRYVLTFQPVTTAKICKQPCIHDNK